MFAERTPAQLEGGRRRAASILLVADAKTLQVAEVLSDDARKRVVDLRNGVLLSFLDLIAERKNSAGIY